MGEPIKTVADFQRAKAEAERRQGALQAQVEAAAGDETGLTPEERDLLIGAVVEGYTAECYSEEPCPTCGDGCVFGPDFPNGDNHGTCLQCGARLLWDNDLGEWQQEDAR